MRRVRGAITNQPLAQEQCLLDRVMMRIMVLPVSFQSFSTRPCIFSRVSASSAPSGSSIQHDLWIVGEAPRQRHALLHAARQLIDRLVAKACRTARVERARHRFANRGARPATVGTYALSQFPGIARPWSSGSKRKAYPISVHWCRVFWIGFKPGRFERAPRCSRRAEPDATTRSRYKQRNGFDG